ncbi:flagella biosynthesis regulator [Erwinia sp. OLTSP20]|uniref:flagella biosynthesis regulator Flk n=1 Tax=unclassified Erwinia TaxID=2622719 RepID=UPI000C1A02AE|nr:MULTISPECIES: flagella biosynthesis regulator Flk [unclassified Erwinia]PIJ51515.1 flagella biosynthesis regulator [Erwinia sp. OAMSP11]PIJ75898.1 flagella biosynthesis regulator [Erwinia sp. OLSSP12]PIJ83426.1 flagella biosynthesis regulator [Erwinia sp. OLCASP19]PIJ86259.1 flagella biosynthesis regulator [Erwinia sp. OLMTSP26]PIJ88498.1 flagella biosynthesis regulator [Erwinia sp. OLMDSP33]
MQPLNGPGAPLPGNRPQPATPATSGDSPMSPAQRTSLERLVIKLLAISSLKSPEVWAGIRHQVGVKNDNELLARHFPAAEQYLNARLSEAQTSHGTRQLQQQLTAMLPLGNNRQAVSDFIRQQFGHTVLSTLTPDQLRQVLTMLQSGQMTIPQPRLNPATDRTLLPAEHQALNQQITRLAATTGDAPASIWTHILQLVNLQSGDPVPSRFYPLLTQYLHVHQTLSQHSAPTLSLLVASLKQPPAPHEHRLLEETLAQQFQLTPSSTLSGAQAQLLLDTLFSQRAERLREQRLADNAIAPQPIVAPVWGFLPGFMQSAIRRPLLSMFIALAVVILLLWLLR